MGKLSDEHPELAQQIISGVDLSTVTSGSGKIAVWLCGEGHQYKASVRHRVYGHGCPYCSGNKILVGFNDLATTHPHLTKEWADETLTPTKVSAGSHKTVTWKCGNNHVRRMKIRDRVQANPECKQCLEDKTKAAQTLLKQIPELATQVHPTLNSLSSVTSLPASSKEKIWWICAEGHEWEAQIKNRFHGRGCPYCAGNKVLPGFNDLATTHPRLAKEWTDSSLTPQEVSAGSEKTVSWVCDNKHTYTAVVNSRAKGGASCPYCSGKKVLPGFNDLATTHTHLMKEWADLQNHSSQISAGSRTVVEWGCPEGHTWRMRVNERTRKEARGCPECASSHGERELSEWLTTLGLNVIRGSRKVIPPHELDIYFPDKKFAMEYNGTYWHSEEMGKDRNYHLNKTLACQKAGITLVHIWEDDWVNRKDIVKRMLLAKLGFLTERKVAARATTPVQLTSVEAEAFFTTNHIQGFKPSSISWGLKDSAGEIVAGMLLTSTGEHYTLERYATACLVPGGFTKLLKHALKTVEWGTVKTFADLTISTGQLYKNTGWEKVETLPPDYRYVVNGERVHKFNYRKARFQKDPTLLYEETLTERQLVELNRLNRIWDCGKIKYVLKNPNVSATDMV